MKRALIVAQFVPLSVFVAVARARGFTPEAWGLAFSAGGLLAGLETVLLALLRLPQNRLLVGANLWLAVGGIGFVAGSPLVRDLYGQLRESALFLCVFVIGAVTTLVARGGFIEAPEADRARVRRASVSLLGVAGLCVVLSLVFRGNTWLAGTLPFILLIAARARLRAGALSGLIP